MIELEHSCSSHQENVVKFIKKHYSTKLMQIPEMKKQFLRFTYLKDIRLRNKGISRELIRVFKICEERGY